MNGYSYSYTVTEHGAVADGTGLCTAAFQHTIDLCAQRGGGYVDVPAGTYLVGTLRLKSHVFLRLAPGCTLLASANPTDFSGTERGCAWSTASNRLNGGHAKPNPCPGLIVAENEENCGILGEGCIEGQRGSLLDPDKSKGPLFLTVFSRCRNVRLETVTMQNPGSFTVYMLNCTYVQIRGVRVFSRHTRCGDGLDFDGSRYVTISDCILDTGDDGIGLKTLTPGEPCEDFTITNCHIRTGTCGAIRLGPESTADMRRIAVSNCVFDHCNDGIKLQLCEDSVFEDFSFTNILMNAVVRPFFITSNRFAFSSLSKSVRPPAGVMRRMSFSHIRANTERRPDNYYCEPCSVIMGLPGAVIEDLAFTDVRITAPGALKAAEVCPLEWLDYTQLYPEENRHLEPMPPTHFYCKHTGALSFSHCFFGCEQPDERPAVVAEDVRFLALYQTRAENSGGLLRHIACPVIRGDFAAQEAQPYTDAQTALWTTYREEAAALNDAMERVAALFDGLQAPRCLCEQAAAPGTKTAAMTIERQEPGHTYLFCPAARGAWELRINGSTIDRFPMPPYFRFSTPLLWDITPHLTGSNDCVELAAASAEAELTAARIQLLHTLR